MSGEKCLSIHLTDLCNSECSFCVVGSPLYMKDSVDYEEVRAFLFEHARKGFEAVNLHGGEPTIHPRFIDTLKLINKLGYPEVHLQTNGIRLADRDFVKTLIGLNVSKFIVSLHGDSAELQDSQTFSKGGFEKTISGIRNAKALGKHVRTNTVITVQNLERLGDIARLACNLGVDHVNFSNMHPVGSARFSRVQNMPSVKDIACHLDSAINTVLKAGRELTLEGFPYCSVPGEGRQELHLNNEYRDIKLLIRGSVVSNYDSFMNEDMRVFGDPCKSCVVRELCGGVYPEYVEYYGWSEFKPYSLFPDGLTRLLTLNSPQLRTPR